jgi:hypothetical protein
MKLKIEITFGIGQDKEGRQLEAFVVEGALKSICREAVDVWGGCTLLDSAGHWQSEASGRYFNEFSKVLVIYCDDVPAFRDAAVALAQFTRDQLRQECVCLTITNCEFQLV